MTENSCTFLDSNHIRLFYVQQFLIDYDRIFYLLSSHVSTDLAFFLEISSQFQLTVSENACDQT